MSKRPRLSRRRHVPTLDELARADGVDVDQLLREVSEFRLALDTDLTIAAAAADAAADHIAPVELWGELTDQALEAGRSALDELVTRRRLDVAAIHPRLATAATGAAAPEPAPARMRRRGARSGHSGSLGPAAGRPAGRRLRGVPLIGVGPLVGVAIVLGLGTGFFASSLHGSSQSRGLTNAADTSLHSLSSALGDGNEQAAREASNQLSAAIGSLIAAAPSDPAAAQAAASALTAEQSLLANTGGPLGDQLRASMSAQVVALQATVHTPIATLLAPSTHPSATTLTIPVPLPTRLLPSLTQIVVLPSLVGRLTPSHHATPSHTADPLPSLVTLLLPPTSVPSAAPVYPAAATPSPAATPSAVGSTAASSPTPSATGSPTPSPSTSTSASTGPLPFSTAAGGGVSYLPH